MLAIYHAPMLMTQAPPSVVRPGDVAALMRAQRARRLGAMAGWGREGRRPPDSDTPGVVGGEQGRGCGIRCKGVWAQ